MMEYLHNFHFLRPWFLLLLIIPLFLYFSYFKSGNIQSSWQKVIDKRLISYLLIKGSAKKRKLFTISALLAGILSVIAVSGPSFNKIEIPYFETQNPVVIALNLSSDMKETDILPSRLNRAKYKISDFLNMTKGVQTGLIVYSSEPFMISPISEDEKIIANLLPAVNFDIMPANGDRLDRAIAYAVQRIKSSGYNKGNIIFFTSDVGQRFDLAIEEAKKAKSSGIKISIVGVTASNNEKLEMIANSGGGEYWNIQNDDAKIAELAKKLQQPDDKVQESKNMRTIWLDSGWYLIPPIMLFCLLFFRKGILVVAFVFISTQAHAGFFTNANQDGLREFKQNNYQKAVEHFNDSNWKAASYYRLGNYQQALKDYQKDNSVTGMYNQGNALAKSGKIAEAIKKYEEVLEIDANHEDAKFNLEYLKKQQNNQNNQQKPKPNPNQKPDDNDNPKNNQQPDNSSKNQSEAEENNQSQDSGSGEQNQDSNSSSGENEQNQENKSSSEENEQNQDSKSSSEENLGANRQEKQQKTSSGAMEQEGNDGEKYDEEMQAKARRYREIPEDPGGLLKALIYQEYRQNRYNEQ